MFRFLTIIAVLCLAWAAGFIAFVTALPRQPLAAPAAEGIVVYTGGGARIAAGVSLMQQGAARRLLISGVNPETTRDALIKTVPEAAPIFTCCVDLGLAATTTEENAVEVRDWTQAHRFRSLILVTSEYHMPRALVETRWRLPGVKIIAFPVASGLLNANGRPETGEAWRRLAFEFNKYLLVRVKTAWRKPSAA